MYTCATMIIWYLNFHDSRGRKKCHSRGF